VLTDMSMPGGMNGLELAQEVTARHPGLPVVLMSGFSDEMTDAAEKGWTVLRKPFTRAVLDRALAEVLARD
jgi:DNA-binding NtrC family response regulator